MGRCYRAKVEAAMPGTTVEIAERAGVERSTTVRWMLVMRKEGACHISGWVRTVGTGGPIKAIYALGPGIDAPCRLKRQGDAVYSKRYRAKVVTDDDAAEVYRAKKSARHWSKKARTVGDPMVNLLFGRTNKQQQANQ